ncbi:hypothetical protein [Sphingomonas crocodyli]|uniref:Uncharacterized protein n=1 Tax=Sphingomonas crocodyli TaxID=1979270 RepID=A0A437LXZ3_9SPHN|nr:hypothetical protein [Sphingomonas crocodyli]RVT90247.1 hypothetical protein EOD43_18305 [Sphingomonas crocodyli]
MALADIDAWIGKTLFIPPIIKLCQITRQSQFAVSRLLWFVVALDQLRLAHSLAQQIVAGLFALIMMFTASLRADLPTMSMLWLRVMGWGFLAFDLIVALLTNDWRGVEIWALVLFAEYAATIRTIPPKEIKKHRRGAQQAGS